MYIDSILIVDPISPARFAITVVKQLLHDCHLYDTILKKGESPLNQTQQLAG